MFHVKQVVSEVLFVDGSSKSGVAWTLLGTEITHPKYQVKTIC